MGRGLLAVLLFAMGCHAELENAGQPADASTSTTDAAVGTDAMVDAPVGCANGRVVYLNFEGTPLVQGTSDATLNRAGWMNQATGTAPAYHLGGANRLLEIQAITTDVRQRLASFPITVVTTRPTSGEYVMIVFGGTAAEVGSAFGGAVNRLDCGDLHRNDLAWIGDGVTPTTRVVNFTVGAIGFGLGLTATLTTTDCMCGWDNACVADNTVACVLTDNIARDPAANQLCPALTMQNETQAFTQAFCQ